MKIMKWLVAGAVAATAPAALLAQGSPLDRLQVHGYLTQAYAQSDSLSIIGITKDGVSDYRAAALQFRYAISDNENLVVQLNHRRLGSSVLNGAQSDVALNWAFYQRRVGDGSVRIGRVPMPRGIYNEVRSVGTMLPFFRAPYNFYTESFETIDGLVASHALSLGGWSADASVMAGGVDFAQLAATAQGVGLARARGDKAVGATLWINTPVPGLRIGANDLHLSFANFPYSETANVRRAASVRQVSLDGNFSRVLLRGEAERLWVDNFAYTAWYAQAGVKPTERLGLYFQTDRASVHVPVATPFGPLFLKYPYAMDNAASVNFAISSSVVAKLEAHRAHGYQFDSYRSPLQSGLTTNYGVFSVAASF